MIVVKTVLYKEEYPDLSEFIAKLKAEREALEQTVAVEMDFVRRRRREFWISMTGSIVYEEGFTGKAHGAYEIRAIWKEGKAE